MKKYIPTIGVEVHVQLKTESKIFCSCPVKFGSEPNTNICPVCTGQPGTLPVFNRQAFEYGIMAGKALECEIARVSNFDRKHYMYPDLPKNYQITQDERPICSRGVLTITDDKGLTKSVRIRRIHLEEDAGKNIHGQDGESYVDLNRAGTPLIEIVSEPDLDSSDQVRQYLTELHQIIRYLGISECNMEEGSFRADVNISIRPEETSEYGTRVELKNINSFKFIFQATEYEINRQIEALERGERIHQETRLWDTKEGKTVFMRSKETAPDYRYMTDPDLPLLVVSDEFLHRITKAIPELPQAKIKRFCTAYNLGRYEATVLCEERERADYFEQAAALSHDYHQLANWMLRNVFGYLKDKKISIGEFPITPSMLAELVEEVAKGVVNSSTAQEVFLEMAETREYPSIIIDKRDLKQVQSLDLIEPIVQEVFQENPTPVADYRSGSVKVLGFIVGLVMKKMKGKGNPQIITTIVKKLLTP